ncbi:MAG: bifunctional diguanylate cyclase/phosphodiesterase [Chelatococcus sp.]|nr:MAG: bifunctional diguanylate cyclase/phosphodiesterase [Chelatococcus sp.]
MRLPIAGNTPRTASSAKMLAGTVVALGSAFLLVLIAATAIVMAIVSDANRLEALRQRERIDAAFDSLIELRGLQIDGMAAAADLEAVLRGSTPAPTRRSAFERLSSRFAEFDGAYVVTSSGIVLAGSEAGFPAGQAGYDGLKHFSSALPGGPEQDTGDGGPDRSSSWSAIIHDGMDTVLLIALNLSSRVQQDAAPGTEPLSMVGYRRVSEGMLADLTQRYRVADIRLVAHPPADSISQRPITRPDGAVAAWLTWTPERPGDTMLKRFIWALVGIALLFVALLAFVIQRLRNAAREVALREHQIRRLAGQDELSLLPNRRTFDLRLDQELAQFSRGGAPLAVMLLDLDRFKAVNDTYGHTAGDELIRQVAARLSAIVRTGDTVARLGGDEFGIIQTQLPQPSACAVLCERILACLTTPFRIMGVEMTIGCSIGIALAPQDGTDRETILKLADTALYQSKNSGRNRYSFFEAQMNRSLQMKRLVEDDLRRAIERNELVIHYQPQVSIDGATIVGVEALVRWPHPVHGLVPPSEFIGIAEERGLIVPLSEWVLRQACLEAKRWKDIRLSVNVSPIQFRHKDFVADVLRIIGETGFDPARLELELTEGVVVEDADAAEAAMMDLRAHGVGLALDDFGTGYSSLIYLRRFAFDKIKIDRSFLEYMETTGESAILVHSIAHLGRALGLRVCAEGVETMEQRRFLQAIGCHELQGFLFSRALPAHEIDRLLALDEPFAEVMAAA